MLSFQICAFSFCFFLFFWKVSKEGTLVWCIRINARRWYFRWFARRLILEICFPIYFWSSGEVVGWDSKMPSKNSAWPREECLCEPGSSPKELPRRNRYFSPSRFRLGLGTKCSVWSCLLLLVRHRQRPTSIVSALMFRKFTLLPDSYDLLLRVRQISVDFTCFLSFCDF